jgi:hypothetical protein
MERTKGRMLAVRLESLAREAEPSMKSRYEKIVFNVFHNLQV